MFKQLIGNQVQMESLMTSVFNVICAYQTE